MARIVDTVRKHLAEEFGSELEEPDEDGAIIFRFVDDGLELGCMALADDDSEQLTFYSVWPKPVPEARRATVMEFITRANYGLPIGNFEMDLEDGEVRVKTSVDLENVVLTPAMCTNIVDGNFAIFERYGKGLARIIAGEASPATAIEDIEAEDDEDQPAG